MRNPRWLAVVAVVGASTLTLAACGSTSADSSGTPTALAALGKGEGQVSILAWPGYVEDGSNDPAVDWVSSFEEETGCEVTSKAYGTSDEALNLAKSGDYDVIAASGDLSLRLVAAGELQPINTDLVPSYEGIFDFLKDKPWNTVDGVNYGIPHGYGANLLMYNSDVVTPAPTSWDVVFDKAGTYSGKISAYDSPIYIADAAVYLMATQPELGITNPYALDETQLAAAVDLLTDQRKHVGEYWSDYLKLISAFQTGDTVASTSWQVIANSVGQPNVQAVLPDEGATGWNDTWMVSSHSENVNCAYLWLDHIASPEVNAQATEYFGEAPNSEAACSFTADPEFCATYHAGDESYAESIWFWTTPVAECLDGRTDTECTDYAEWTTAWTQIKG